MSDHELSPEEMDDLSEFLRKEDYGEHQHAFDVANNKPLAKSLIYEESDSSDAVAPGVVTQYALYSGGYTATTATVSHLPAGCYDILADNKCIRAVPVDPPTGILLELPEMRSEEVIKIVETFWNSEADYKNGNEFVIGGAAYKSGIMVYGPPGSGKSCTLKLVSKKLVERGGTVFYGSGFPGHVMSFLYDFARIEKNRKSIVILEDIDSLIGMHGEASYLEMLDSAKTIDNVMFIATTNYPERLDPRIYNRPGRFSHVVKIGLPVAKTREAYLKAILKNHRDIPEIVSNSAGFTIDHLTALTNAVYREKKNLQKEMQRLRLLFNMPKSDERTMGISAIGISTEDANA
jgi:ATPase family associated with various cellular activities (AAA)